MRWKNTLAPHVNSNKLFACVINFTWWVDRKVLVFETRIQRVHVEENILMAGDPNRIDPDKWKPLIMSLQKFYGLAPGQIHESTLGRILESLYRSPDVDRARRQHERPSECTAAAG